MFFSSRKAPYRIFQIGFNRCGTSSIQHFFEQNGFSAAHWRNGKIAIGMKLAKLRGKPLLTYVKDFDVYTDMEKVNVWRLPKQKWTNPVFWRFLREAEQPIENHPPVYAFKYFKQLASQYPESKFILNTRDREKWIQSRLNLNKNNDRIAYRSCPCGDNYHENEDQLTSCWQQEWETHHQHVQEFFRDKPDRLLQFDIEKDDVTKLTRFFDDLDLDKKYWRQTNATV